MTFEDVLRTCANNEQFVAQWARLRGFKLAGSPIERMVDDATGYSDDIADTFISDVRDLVWNRVPRQAANDHE